MEEKRRDAGILAMVASESPASESPASTRRRGGAQKRKGSNLVSSGSSSTSSKRVTREKSSFSHPPIHNHNGPLTRARQGPNNHTLSSAGGISAALSSVVKPEGQGKVIEASNGEAVVAMAEELRKESEFEALVAGFEADFEVIRSRDPNTHVVPSHCGWFSWTNVHPIEERMLPSFFSGTSDARTPEMYLDIRNWIIKKFHANPSKNIESNNLSEIEVGDLDARQEVMEFLDYWGMINFHPFPPTGATDDAVGISAAEKDSLVDKLYHFETPITSMHYIPKTNTTAPTVPSGLFPDSTFADELLKSEGPAVEYHCNSCSADCSRKRYHCQKQADYDLCMDCFKNGKFDSGMSSSDFIVMEPAEVPGVGGGKWTDQETLLLLEALELYKENWNEIAEHVATKTKSQCILHFVQMPIEDTFLDYDVDIDAGSKETPVPDSTDNDTLVRKDAAEATECNADDANENQSPTSPKETSKEDTVETKDGKEASKDDDATEAKACKETQKLEDTSEAKVGEETLKLEDSSEAKLGEETQKLEDASESKIAEEAGEDIALKALKDAFEAVGYPLKPEAPLSFAEVGNPVMALATFLSRLVGPDIVTASAHNSLKSLSGNSPGIELATRHCFILEDPPNDNKELAGSDSIVVENAITETYKEETQEDRSQKEGTLEDKSDKKREDASPEGKRPLSSQNGGSSEDSRATKEQDGLITLEEVGPGDLDKSSNSQVPKNQLPSTIERESDDLKSEAELSPHNLKKSGEGTPAEPSEATETPKDVEMSDSLASERNESQEPIASNLVSRVVDVVSNKMPAEKTETEQMVDADSVGGCSQSSEAKRDLDMISEPQHSRKDEPTKQLASSTTFKPGSNEDQSKDDSIKKQPCSKDHPKIDMLKRAAVCALSAAAVKAKLLADQEEDQIRQLSTLLIEKQLHKLEAKLAFFSEMENIVMRSREQLDRSRQRLYHERAQIIASRLGLPASSSRIVPPSTPPNRIATNITNSAVRPPASMFHRPPLSRSMGAVASNPSLSFSSTTTAGSTTRPPSQDKLSSVGTK